MLEKEIDEFGRRIGLPGLKLNDNGLAQLNIEGLGCLSLELAAEGRHGERDLIFSIALSPDAHAAEKLPAAFASVNSEERLPLQMATGLLENRLILSARLSTDRVRASDLENALRLLLSKAEALR